MSSIISRHYHVSHAGPHHRDDSHHHPHSPVMTPTVYRLAADRKYSAIAAAVAERPHDLQWVDSYGSTALHLLCQARDVTRESLGAVAVCVQVLPKAVQWANAATWTPLHFAVFQQSQGKYRVQLILLLLRVCPEALSVRAVCGYKSKTAFHFACELNADFAILHAMLQLDPSLATASYLSPKQQRLQKQQEQHHRSAQPNYCQYQALASETPLHILYKSGSSNRKMALLLEAAVRGQVRDLQQRRRVVIHQAVTNTFRLVHAACRIDNLPRAYFLQLLNDHPDAPLQRDEHGYLPLHYVLTSVKSNNILPSPYQQFVLQELLERAPQAARIASAETGALPLHMALEHGWSWEQGCQDLIFCDNATALRIPDPVTAFLPFQAAAVAQSWRSFTPSSSATTTSTIYELLRAAPDLLDRNG